MGEATRCATGVTTDIHWCLRNLVSLRAGSALPSKCREFDGPTAAACTNLLSIRPRCQSFARLVRRAHCIHMPQSASLSQKRPTMARYRVLVVIGLDAVFTSITEPQTPLSFVLFTACVDFLSAPASIILPAAIGDAIKLAWRGEMSQASATEYAALPVIPKPTYRLGVTKCEVEPDLVSLFGRIRVPGANLRNTRIQDR